VAPRPVTPQQRGQFLRDYIELLLNERVHESPGFRHLAPGSLGHQPGDTGSLRQPARGHDRWVINKIRALCSWYTKGFEGGAQFRIGVNSAKSISELTAADAHGNRGSGERVAIDTRDTFIHSEDRIVATIGVDSLVIVDTRDAVLVAHKDHLQRVKDVVGELKARGHDSYKLHKTISRPWGTYTVLEEGPGFKMKRIEVKPGGQLSLQLHHRRSEHWVVVRGTAHVTIGERVYDVQQGESTFVPVGTRHRLENRGAETLALIEVACGNYIEEDDIVRFDDKYGRVPA